MNLDKIIKKIRNSELSEEDVLKYGRILITEFAKEYHNEAINYTRCYVSEAEQLFCSTCGSKNLCASCMRMPIQTIQDKIKNNCT